MTVVGQVATHSFTAHREIRFDWIRLAIPRGQGWSGGACHFEGPEETAIPCAVLSEIHASGSVFPVAINGADRDYGPVLAEGLTTQLPFGADAFIYRKRENGFWVGLTLATAYGALVLLDYECDPA